MSIKRTIITTILALALVATIAPAAAQADTLSSLMAQISALQAQIAALQGTSAPSTGACVGVTFNRNLTVGSTGSDVSCLQQILSVTPATGYFGSKTLAAVRSYQTAHGWTPANQVGPMTRQALNASFGNGTTPVSTPGCPAGAVYNSATAALCATGTTTQTGITTPGATGYLTATGLSASPASNASITATTNVPVLGIDLRAVGSDMIVSSAEVQLTVIKSATAQEFPATAVRNLYVYDGSTLLGTYPVSTSTVLQSSSNSSTYYMILSGFKFVAPVNTTKSLLITADFTPGLETTRALTINLYGQGLRAVDGTGAYSSETSLVGTATVSGATVTAPTYYRQQTVTYATVGTSTLSVAVNTSTPISSTINVNHTSGTTNVPMFVFNAHSITGASTVTSLKFTVQGDNANVAKINALKLYDGSTLLGSQSLVGSTSGAYATFSNISIPVAQDAYKALTVSADFAAVPDTDTTGVRVVILDPATDVYYQTPNVTSANPTATAAVQGNYMHLFDGVSPDLSFTSATSTYSYNTTTPTLSYSTGIITFKVHANGGTVTALTSSTVTTNWNNGSDHSLGTTYVSVDFAPVGGTDGADLQDGGDAIVTITATVPRTTSSTGFVKFDISSIVWSVGPKAITQTWGLGDYKTPYVNVQ